MTIKEIEDKYLIFLKKEEIIDFKDIAKHEDFFIKLFTRIKNRYESFNRN